MLRKKCFLMSFQGQSRSFGFIDFFVSLLAIMWSKMMRIWKCLTKICPHMLSTWQFGPIWPHSVCLSLDISDLPSPSCSQTSHDIPPESNLTQWWISLRASEDTWTKTKQEIKDSVNKYDSSNNEEPPLTHEALPGNILEKSYIHFIHYTFFKIYKATLMGVFHYITYIDSIIQIKSHFDCST